MNTAQITGEDILSIVLAVICIVLICIIAIQMKRLGRPDERSTPIRSYMLAVIFISFIVVAIPVNLFTFEKQPYHVLGPLALSLLLALVARKFYEKRRIL